MFNQREEPKTVKLIDSDVIDNLVRTLLFDSTDGDDKILNNRLLELHKYLLGVSKSKNKSQEVGILWDIISNNYVLLIGSENSIDMYSDDKARYLLNNTICCSLVFLHNHPKCSSFSYKDFDTFCSTSNILAMTAVCNDGRIHIMKKLIPYQFNGGSILFEYNKKHDETDKGMPYIFKNHSKLGLLYRCSVTRVQKGK